MITNYDASARLLRRAAKHARYSVTKQLGSDWWTFTAVRPTTTYARFEGNLLMSIALILFDAVTPVH
jgi:hypothetical protein